MQQFSRALLAIILHLNMADRPAHRRSLEDFVRKPAIMAMRREEGFNSGFVNNLICTFVTTTKLDRNFNAVDPGLPRKLNKARNRKEQIVLEYA